MRATFLITLLMTVLLSIVCVLMFSDTGYVLLSYENKVIETSLNFFIIVEVVILVSVMLVWMMIRNLVVARFGFNFVAARKVRKAQENTNAGLLYLAEMNWEKAELLLVKSAGKASSPVVNYLNAAKAVNALGDHTKRDEYLQLAMNSSAGADVAIGLTQAEFHFQSSQWDSCLATLLKLQETSPKHPSILKMLSQVLDQLGDWEKLKELLPQLKKLKVFSKEEHSALEQTINSHSRGA